MNDRSIPVILGLAGRCPHCGATRCSSTACFRRELARHEAAPILSRPAADKLARGLMAVGWTRAKATERVGENFTIIA